MTDTLVMWAGALFVRCEMPHSAEPLLTVLYWRVRQITANAYTGSRPEAGDALTRSGGGGFAARRGDCPIGSVELDPSAEAEHVEVLPVPAPKVGRGTPTRWRDGR